MNQPHLIIKFCLLAIVALILTSPVAAGASAPQVMAEKANGQADQKAQADRNIWTMKRWSPYWVGIGIGILSWLAFVLSDKPIGVSTAYAQTSGMIEKALRGRDVAQKEYYRKYVPKISWTWMLVVGLFAGAFVSAAVSGDFQLQWVSLRWQSQFGHAPIIRLATAFAGGVILGIGARWADGCTSGHGISGTLQLVVSSWIAVICFFVSGVVIANVIY